MAKDTSVSVKVTGLAEVNRALKRTSDELKPELKAELLKVADKVAGDVQQRMPWLTGRAIQSVAPHSTAGGASIAAGGRAAPYYGWLDFGGTTGRGHVPGKGGSGSISRPYMGKGTGEFGRYLYPAIMADEQVILEDAGKAIDTVMGRAGFTVRKL